MGTLIINRSTVENLKQILRSINIGDKDTIQRLFKLVKVVDLQLSKGETLLVRIPGTSRISISTTVRTFLYRPYTMRRMKIAQLNSSSDPQWTQIMKI